jgi:hypothetical protein
MTAHGIMIAVDRRHGERRRTAGVPVIERRRGDRRVQEIDDRLRHFGWALVDASGYHVEVFATGLQGVWDAIVRIRRNPSGDQVHFERVPFGEPTPDRAELRALIWAKHWVGSKERS